MNFDYQRGFVVNPEAPPDSLEAKRPYIDNGVGNWSKNRYFCRDFMQQEADKLWSRTWLIAGASSEIPDTGDYLVFEIGSESIIVVRTTTGIRAHFNVCPHRGTRLVRSESGRDGDLSAPFIPGSSA